MPRELRWQRHFLEELPGMPWALGLGFDQMLRCRELRSHTHEGHELTFLLDGEVSWETSDGEKLDLRGGIMGLTQPGLPHWGQWQIVRPCRIVWLIADMSKHESAPMRALHEALSKSGNCTRAADERLRTLFLELKDALHEHCLRRKEPLALARLKCAFEHVIAVAAAKFGSSAEAASKPGGALTAMLEKLAMERPSRPVSVAEMAKRAGFSAARFTELFKEESGMTPADYILRFKCLKAREMLKNRKLTITEISCKLGFSSSQHFARAFKNYTGTSPSQFRLSL